MNCPFCKPDNSAAAFAISEENKAVYNLAPILQGHSLIIPVKHITSLFDLNEDEISTFFSFARRVTAFLCEIYECDAYDWSLQEGTEAGQSIEHLHLHIIPRKAGDFPESGDWYGKLQHSLDPANNERFVLSVSEHQDITRRLKGLWK